MHLSCNLGQFLPLRLHSRWCCERDPKTIRKKTLSFHLTEKQYFPLQRPPALLYIGCPESVRPFWISREAVMWPWCNLAACQRRPYCASTNSHSPVGLVSRQWYAVDWACVLCDRRIQNDRASRSASSRQCACPFYSSRAGFFDKALHHPGLSAPPLQPRFGSLLLLAYPKAKIAVERESICFYCFMHYSHRVV